MTIFFLELLSLSSFKEAPALAEGLDEDIFDFDSRELFMLRLLGNRIYFFFSAGKFRVVLRSTVLSSG